MGIRSLVATFGLDLADQPLILAPRTPVAAYATGIIVTMVAAWLPARRTGRIAPVQALRDDVALPESSVRRRLLLGIALIALGIPLAVIGLFVGAVPHNGWWVGAGVLAVLLGVTAASPVIGRPFLRATGAADAKLFGPIGQLAGQNSLRNPRRTTATASALMIGLTLAFTVAILGVVRQGVGGRAGGGQLHRRLHRQQRVRRGVLAGDHRPDGRHRRRGLGAPGAVRLRPPRRRPDVRRGHRAGDDLRLRHDHGLRPGHATWPTARSCVEKDWASENHVTTGDTYEITVPTGKEQWRIVGVFEETPLIFSPVLTTTQTLIDSGFPDQDNYVVIFAEDGPAAAGLQERLDAVVKDLPVVTVKDEQAFAAEQRAPIDRIIGVIYVLLVFAVLIAILGIVNTLALSVIERTREIGLLRAIGVSRRQLRLMIRLESVVIAVLGAVLGVGLGIVFGVTLMYALRDQGLERISIPVGQLVVFLALSLVIGVLAAVFPARRAARLDVLRAIATE